MTTSLYGQAHRDQASAASNNQLASLVTGRRGDLLVQAIGKPLQKACDQGSLFVCTNPTPGTGVAGIAATGAFADAESTFLVRNAATAGEDVRVILERLRVTVTVAGTNGTDHRYVSKLDTGTTRYTSGGGLIAAVNPNMQSTAVPKAAVYMGALVTTAASASARLVACGLIRSVIAVVGDQYVFDFGGQSVPTSGIPTEGTLQANVLINHPPVVLGPTDQWVFSLFATAQTVATSYEFELLWREE